ncbi:hypothetical protein K1T71_008862 [Dendrolimus kikuchii]|uniref:Uncharacterized protein n=1 Tax=Dendrolimus kikuchii TaxID=765133 RepID=A0ACC1CVL1_9NEOP|nr:hypothetical protein K1T71_008862 [Dendrolimus kikuchii]
MPACGGRCNSREVIDIYYPLKLFLNCTDCEFPFKVSYQPVCMYGSRRMLKIRLRHCDSGVDSATEIFHFVGADNYHCKICSSQYTSCEWLPPNSTLLDESTNY